MDAQGKLVAGRYQLVESAGDGGMAEVWRALTRGAAGFARPVAIKRIHEHLASSTEFVRMFIEEARVSAALDHPNIVQTHDFGQDGSGYYLVMEWVDGLHLGQYVQAYRTRDESTPWRLIAAIGAGVAGALEAAHTRLDAAGRPAPVFHRDVTPQNILVSLRGVAKLTDFGLARAMDRARMTQPDVVKGKLSYLAPELTHGKPASPQSDLYALGIVLWESLAMARLYEAETDAERVLKVRDGRVPPLSEQRDGLPKDLVEVVHRALQRDPEARWESAHDMQRALLRVGGEDPVAPAELGESVKEARLALGLGARSLPPSEAGTPRGLEEPVRTSRVVVVRSDD